MIYSVYCITNLSTNKRYIGITSQTLEMRLSQHIKEARNNSDRYLCRAIRKYGSENFTIELVDDSARSPEELYILEQKYIELYDTHAWLGNGYNMTFGGEGTIGRPCNEETKKKISLSHKGKKIWINGNIHPALGTKQSEESNNKRRDKLKGRPLLKETIDKLISAFSNIDRTGENNPMFGKHHSEDSKQKMCENNWYKTNQGKLYAKQQSANMTREGNHMYGKKWDEEHLSIFREKSSGANNPRAVPIVILDSNNVIVASYKCTKDAIGFLGITRKQLENRIKNGKEYKGHFFKTYSDYEKQDR